MEKDFSPLHQVQNFIVFICNISGDHSVRLTTTRLLANGSSSSQVKGVMITPFTWELYCHWLTPAMVQKTSMRMGFNSWTWGNFYNFLFKMWKLCIICSDYRIFCTLKILKPGKILKTLKPEYNTRRADTPHKEPVMRNCNSSCTTWCPVSLPTTIDQCSILSPSSEPFYQIHWWNPIVPIWHQPSVTLM